MSNQDFDKYMQDNLGEELTPPDSLNWDNMDIQLPPKRKRRIFILPIIVLGASALLYFGIGLLQPGGSMLSIADLPLPQIALSESLTASQANTTLSTTSKEEPVEHLSVAIESVVEETRDVSTTDQLHASSEESFSSPATTTSNSSSAAATLSATVTDASVSAFVKENSPLSLLSGLGIDQLAGNTSAGLYENLPNVDSIREALSRMAATQAKTKNQLQFTYGMTWTQPVFNASSSDYLTQLENTTTAATNSIISMGWNRQLNRQWMLQVSGTWLRMHHTFDYEEDLGFEDDFDNLIRTYFRRIVHHNNTLDLVELNVGFAYQQPLALRSKLRFYAQLNPGLVLSHTGRTLNQKGEVVSFTTEQRSGLAFNAGVGLDYVYQLENISLVAGVSTRKMLTNVRSVESMQVTNRPVIGTFRVGILTDL